MKHLCLLTLAICCLSLYGYSQESDVRSIVVHGEAEMSIAADRAIVQVGIRAKGRSFARALENARQSADKLQAELLEAGVREQDIARAVDAEDNGSFSSFFGGDEKYRAKVALRVTVVRATQLGEVIALIRDIDGGKTPTVFYEHSHDNIIRQEVLELAMQNARDRATTMATAVGARVGGLLFAEELEVDQEDREYPLRRSREIQFSARVKAIFALEDIPQNTNTH